MDESLAADLVADQAVAALERIGARRTLRMLRAALACPKDPARLDVLDEQFQEAAEDLPGLTMAFLGESME